MNGGRELDALVAEKVMGYEVLPTAWGPKLRNARDRRSGAADDLVPAYSTDIAAAWEVVEKMREQREIRISASPYGYYAQLSGDDWAQVPGDSAAHAICLAALRAIGHEVPA